MLFHLTIIVLQNAKDKMGEDLVKFYLEEWERFTFSSKVMNGFCSYLNRCVSYNPIEVNVCKQMQDT